MLTRLVPVLVKRHPIQAVLNELPIEEKVDIVAFAKNQSQFICNALSPAQNVKVISVKDGLALVEVPESELALAIGSAAKMSASPAS